MLQIGNTSTLVSDYVVYFSDDPAIDKSVEGFSGLWDEYVKTGDASKIPLKPGQEPTRWVLRHLRGKAKRILQDIIRKTAVDDMISPTAVYIACQIALKKAENLFEQNGAEVSLGTTFDKDLRLNIMSESTMQMLDTVTGESGDKGQLVNELGLRAILNLSPDPL